MKRFVSNSVANTEIEGHGGIARRQKDGTFHLSDIDARAAVKADAGFIVPDMGPGRTKDGFRCIDCGWGSWFRTCSKCGGECHRETEA